MTGGGTQIKLIPVSSESSYARGWKLQTKALFTFLWSLIHLNGSCDI